VALTESAPDPASPVDTLLDSAAVDTLGVFRPAPGLRLRVRNQTGWGVADGNGNWLIPPAYTYIWPETDHWFPVSKGGRLGYLDTAGQEVIPFDFFPVPNPTEAPTELFSFAEGRAVAIASSGLFGYIDTTGQWAIEPAYDYAWPFNASGRALVKKGQRLGVVDVTGRWVIQPVIESLEPRSTVLFSQGPEAVSVNGKWGYLDASGQFVLLPQFTCAGPFRNNRACVETLTGVAYINPTGKVVTWLDFEAGRDFYEGRAAAKLRGEWCYIDTTGRVVIFPRYTVADDFTNGLARVCEGERWGIIDNQGQYVVPAEFEALIYPAPENRLPAKQNGKWGYVALTGERAGEWAVPPGFEAVKAFSNNRAAVKKAFSPWGYIRPDGALITPLMFDEAGAFTREGLAAVAVNGLWGFLDSTGHWAVPPQFEEAPVQP